MPTATVAVVYAALLAGHEIGDNLAQTDRQAAEKDGAGRQGWTALAAHVATYHLAVTGTVAATCAATGLRLSPRRLAAGLAISAFTHAAADRRTPVRWFLYRTGSAPFADIKLVDPDGEVRWKPGMHAADQAIHKAALWLAALVIGS